MEWRLFEEGTIPEVSTFQFHEHRERAPHLEQDVHQLRLNKAANFALAGLSWAEDRTIMDVGCGDGGLLQLIMQSGVYPPVKAWGYDFTPSNLAGRDIRGVDIRSANFLVDPLDWGSVVIATEVLEHLADPHRFIRQVFDHANAFVCSSPRFETYESHDECHAWAWDMDGYKAMIEDAGFTVVKHESAGLFQVILSVVQ